MLNERIYLFVPSFLFIGLLFLALPEAGFAGFATTPTDCCQISENECADTSEGPILCMEGNLQDNAVCDANTGRCRTELTPIDGVTPIPTLSEWGLIAMAGVLGIIGFMVIRRRKTALQSKVS
jgi:IPTL-CTERM motif